MKTIAQRASRHGVAAALTVVAFVAGCSASSGAGSSFADPESDDAGDGGSSSSSGGLGLGSSGASGGSSSGDAGAKVDACGASCKSCSGVPPVCSSHTTEDACSAVGCTWTSMCLGSSLPCPGLAQSLCGIQQNCTYDNATGQCSGTAYACNVLASAYACSTQQGCSWQMVCSGTPFPCTSRTTSALCTGAGCVWD